MATPASASDATRSELLSRRERLAAAVEQISDNTELRSLLGEVDAALDRVSRGTYGICESCNEPIEPEQLAANPLIRFCLPHLSPAEQRALEQDLELASRIQSRLLPEQRVQTANWEAHYHYAPAGPIGGDYCDLVANDPANGLFFVVGDVAGKGVAASMLSAHLHAMFRTLAALDLPLATLIERANRIFCESLLAGHYATIVCGRAAPDGRVELANAGHLPPLVLRKGPATPLAATGVPLGLFCGSTYGVHTVELARGESLLLYTDGLTESRNPSGAEYGTARLHRFASTCSGLAPEAVIHNCLEDVGGFSAGAPRGDDLTLLALRHLG